MRGEQKTEPTPQNLEVHSGLRKLEVHPCGWHIKWMDIKLKRMGPQGEDLESMMRT